MWKRAFPLLVMVVAWIAAFAPEVALPAEASGAVNASIRGTTQPLEVELLVEENESWRKLARQSLPPSTRTVHFGDLSSGIYQLRVLGPKPTEVLATRIAVGNGEVRKMTITIEPRELTGRVTYGGTAIGSGAVFLHDPAFDLRSTVALGADGTFRVPLWQRGSYRYTIKAAALATPFASKAELDGNSPIQFAVDVPDGRIRGTLRDAKTNAPIAGAVVLLESKLAASEQTVRTKTDPAGRFDFTGVQDGTHTVHALPLEYLEPAPSTFTINRKTRLRELDVRVDPGRAVPLLVLDANEDPVDKATVVAVIDGRPRSHAKTDEDGRADIAVPENQTATLFILPVEGAFGFQRVGAQSQRERLRVHLPAASSSLLIRASTTDGKTMPPFSLLMRYNGELMPAEVADELSELRLATGANGEAHLSHIPAGSYEFWPYRTEEEADSIVAAASVTAAPIVVNVRTGENKIAVKFAAR